MTSMPPYITVNEKDIADFYSSVDLYLEYNGSITDSILFNLFYSIKYYYQGLGDEFLKSIIDAKYVNSGKKNRFGYDLWVAKS